MSIRELSVDLFNSSDGNDLSIENNDAKLGDGLEETNGILREMRTSKDQIDGMDEYFETMERINYGVHEKTNPMNESDTSETNKEDLDVNQIYSEVNQIYKNTENSDFLEELGKIDSLNDVERITEVLTSFKQRNWEKISIDERKSAIEALGIYTGDVLGIEDKPEIVFFSEENKIAGEFLSHDNVIRINEKYLKYSEDVADTLTHEYMHKYQYQRIQNPQTELDILYQMNEQGYIYPEEDDNWIRKYMYKHQIVEWEAREYAERFKNIIDKL